MAESDNLVEQGRNWLKGLLDMLSGWLESSPPQNDRTSGSSAPLPAEYASADSAAAYEARPSPLKTAESIIDIEATRESPLKTRGSSKSHKTPATQASYDGSNIEGVVEFDTNILPKGFKAFSISFHEEAGGLVRATLGGTTEGYNIPQYRDVRITEVNPANTSWMRDYVLKGPPKIRLKDLHIDGESSTHSIVFDPKKDSFSVANLEGLMDGNRKLGIGGRDLTSKVAIHDPGSIVRTSTRASELVHILSGDEMSQIAKNSINRKKGAAVATVSHSNSQEEEPSSSTSFGISDEERKAIYDKAYRETTASIRARSGDYQSILGGEGKVEKIAGGTRYSFEDLGETSVAHADNNFNSGLAHTSPEKTKSASKGKA